MLIYRICQPNGRGLYQRGFADRIGMGSTDSGEHPLPWNDSLFSRNEVRQPDQYRVEEYRFGFHTRLQLRRWMYNDRWLRAADRLGAVLKVYSVPDTRVILGLTQCTFRMRSAKLVRCESLLDLIGVDHALQCVQEVPHVPGLCGATSQ